MSKSQEQALNQRHAELQAQYEHYQTLGLKLDLTRGKPAPAQLDLASALDGVLNGFYLLQDGTDVRNYGGISGIPEARQLGAEILGTSADRVMVGGNSSLTLMYQYVAHMVAGPWQADRDNDASPIKFICLVPGYDRHFTICEHFGIDMIAVPLLEQGPDMDRIEALVTEDASIKGIWCVPRHSNPTGHTYDEATVQRFARLGSMAGRDFRIFWDNAYVVHDLTDKAATLSNLMQAADPANQDSMIILASTSKITFAGAGISFLAASEKNLAEFEDFLGAQTIGFDKVNQLRHVRFLENLAGVQQHMRKHRAIIKPKFDLVEQKLADSLTGKDIATWTQPTGGYFVSLETRPGLASQVVGLAAEAGVKLTPAGATFPYGKDPQNTNIRIAPTFPSIDELDTAMDVLVICIELASVATSLNNLNHS